MATEKDKSNLAAKNKRCESDPFPENTYNDLMNDKNRPKTTKNRQTVASNNDSQLKMFVDIAGVRKLWKFLILFTCRACIRRYLSLLAL